MPAAKVVDALAAIPGVKEAVLQDFSATLLQAIGGSIGKGEAVTLAWTPDDKLALQVWGRCGGWWMWASYESDQGSTSPAVCFLLFCFSLPQTHKHLHTTPQSTPSPQVRDKHVKTFASPELAKGLFSLYLGPKVRVLRFVCVSID